MATLRQIQSIATLMSSTNTGYAFLSRHRLNWSLHSHFNSSISHKRNTVCGAAILTECSWWTGQFVGFQRLSSQCPHWHIMNGPLVTSFDTFSKPAISLLWSLMYLTQRRRVVNEFYKVQHVINNIKQMRWCYFIHPSSVNRCLFLNQKCRGGGVGCIMSLRLKNVSVNK